MKNKTIDLLIDHHAFFQGYEVTKTFFNFIINDFVPKKKSMCLLSF